MIYLDTSAAIKLLVPETHSAALGTWLTNRHDPILSSGLLRVELHRALHRITAETELHHHAEQLLAGIHLRPIDAVTEHAAQLDGQHLRSLDAIHLATALSSDPTPIFTTYDTTLAHHATHTGLTTTTPQTPPTNPNNE